MPQATPLRWCSASRTAPLGGMKLQASSVKQFALEHGIAVAQPRSLRLDGKYPEDAAAARQAIADAHAV